MCQLLNYYYTTTISILALVALCFAIETNYTFTKKFKKNYSLAILVSIVIMILEVISVYYETENKYLGDFYLMVNILGFTISPFVVYFIARVIEEKISKSGRVYIGLLALNALLCITSPFTGLMFNIKNQTYQRGPLYFIFILTYLYGFFYLIYRLIKYMNGQNGVSYPLVCCYVIFFLVGSSCQILVRKAHVGWVCISFLLILFYVYLCEYREKEDKLTGLLNRRAYEYILNKKNKKDGYVIIMDIDNFKNVNDTFGHSYGDFCIKTVAQCIKDVFYSYGKAYRIGGDEFCVIIFNDDEKIINELVSDLNKKIEYYKKWDNNLPSVSSGYSKYTAYKDNLQSIIETADQKLYLEKDRKKSMTVK